MEELRVLVIRSRLRSFHRVKANYGYVRDGALLDVKQLKLLDVFDMRASNDGASAGDVEISGEVAM